MRRYRVVAIAAVSVGYILAAGGCGPAAGEQPADRVGALLMEQVRIFEEMTEAIEQTDTPAGVEIISDRIERAFVPRLSENAQALEDLRRSLSPDELERVAADVREQYEERYEEEGEHVMDRLDPAVDELFAIADADAVASESALTSLMKDGATARGRAPGTCPAGANQDRTHCFCVLSRRRLGRLSGVPRSRRGVGSVCATRKGQNP